MKRDYILFLEDIIENIALIEDSIRKINREKFEKDKDIQDATIRRIEIIGEAVKNISEDFRKKYPKVEWRKIAGTRDVIIHAYFGINIGTIWKVVRENLPVLKRQIQEILKKEQKDED